MEYNIIKMKNPNNIKIRTLDMALADSYVKTEFNIIKNALIGDSLYTPNLLYRGINGANVPKLLKTGQDTNTDTIYFSTEKQINDSHRETTSDIFSHAELYEQPAIACFNPDGFTELFEFAYEFKNPEKKLDSLVVIYLLDY